MSVITCPGPGSGKTVLLRSWISRAGAAGLSERVARVPAGRDERDPQRFWLSVLAALRQTAPRLAAGAGGDGGALMCRLSKTGVWRGFDWQKQPTADPHTPIPKCVANPLADGIIARRLMRARWLLQITASRPRAATHSGTEP